MERDVGGRQKYNDSAFFSMTCKKVVRFYGLAAHVSHMWTLNPGTCGFWPVDFANVST